MLYFANRTYNLDTQVKVSVRLPKLETRGLVRWEDYRVEPIDPVELESQPLPEATFGDLSYPLMMKLTSVR